MARTEPKLFVGASPVIRGRGDDYFTVTEFAEMVGRSAKTVRNWAADGHLQFVHLCGVPLISLRHVEQLITGRVPDGAEHGITAAKMMNRVDRAGRRQQPERRAPHSSSDTR